MTPKAVDSLDLVEAVIAIEEIFGPDISDNDAENFGGPQEIVDWLEPRLQIDGPTKRP